MAGTSNVVKVGDDLVEDALVTRLPRVPIELDRAAGDGGIFLRQSLRNGEHRMLERHDRLVTAHAADAVRHDVDANGTRGIARHGCLRETEHAVEATQHEALRRRALIGCSETP